MNRKILLIGGTGLLSSALTNELINNGDVVTIITRGIRSVVVSDNINFIKSDVYDSETIKKALKNDTFDAVIDFICYTKEHAEYSFMLFKDYAPQYIFISSTAVYDTSIPGIKCENSKRENIIWDYSVNKFNCENYLIEKSKEFRKNLTIIRPNVTYDNTRIPYGLAPAYTYHGTLINRILHGKPMLIWNGGKSRCNILHAEDFAVGLSGLIANVSAYDKAFNICGDIDTAPKWIDVINALSASLKKDAIMVDVPIEFCASKLDNYSRSEFLAIRANDCLCDTTLIKQTVPEFSQKVSLENGINRTVKFYKENNWLKGIDYRFDGTMDKIIYSFLTYSKMNNYDEYNLKYIDYLHENKIKNRIKYIAGRSNIPSIALALLKR